MCVNDMKSAASKLVKYGKINSIGYIYEKVGVVFLAFWVEFYFLTLAFSHLT
jgi:hypothetical protein